MIVCLESSNAPGGRGLFVSLRRRPDSEMEATEIARAIRATAESSAARTLEDGPFGGSPVSVGDEHLGEVVDAPLSRDAPWSAVGISDFSVVQAALQMAHGVVWLPQMREQAAQRVPMTSLQRVCQVGIYDMNIVGSGKQTGFNRIKPPSVAPTYPMLWGHDAQLEKRMVVAPDSEGRVKQGRENRAAEIWETRSHAHHNRDFRFNSQPLAVAFTRLSDYRRHFLAQREVRRSRSRDRVHAVGQHDTGTAVLLVALQSSAGGKGQDADHSHALNADAGRHQAVLGAAREG